MNHEEYLIQVKAIKDNAILSQKKIAQEFAFSNAK